MTQLSPDFVKSITANLDGGESSDYKSWRFTPVNGGDINTCYKVENGSKCWFLKTNENSFAGNQLFEAEAQGLEWLSRAEGLCVPRVLAYGSYNTANTSKTIDGNSICTHYLLMEFLNLDGSNNWTTFADKLAGLHQSNWRPKELQGLYGAPSDNFIGLTRQQNKPSNNWAEFWWQQRLLKQFEYLQQRKLNTLNRYQADLERCCYRILSEHQPKPALVHGDLWQGNWSFSSSGQFYLYDPACYWGDYEVDLAMTRLFGQLPDGFYEYYYQIQPSQSGFALRAQLYNLYHLLNHLNLFGNSYLNSCEELINQLLSSS